MSLLKDLIAEAERGRVKRRLKQAFARKPKPARVRILDDDVPATSRAPAGGRPEAPGNALVDAEPAAGAGVAPPGGHACAQCKKAYKPGVTKPGCPKCAPGTRISEAEFQAPIRPQGPPASPAVHAGEPAGVGTRA